MTKGEYRVGTTFNPSGDDLVAQIKRQAADLIDLIETIDTLGMGATQAAEVGPLKTLAQRDVDAFLEGAEEAAYELCNENCDPLFDVSKEQSEDLQGRIRAAIEAWQYAHSLTFMPWAFTGTKNLERVEETLE